MWKSCHLVEERDQILKNQLKKKAKKIQNLEKTIAEQQEEIHNLQEKDIQIYVHDAVKDKDQFSLDNDDKKEANEEEKVEDGKGTETFEDIMDTNESKNDDANEVFAFDNDNKKEADEEEKVEDDKETEAFEDIIDTNESKNDDADEEEKVEDVMEIENFEEIMDINESKNDDADPEASGQNLLNDSEVAQLEDVVQSITETTTPEQEDEGKHAKKKRRKRLLLKCLPW